MHTPYAIYKSMKASKFFSDFMNAAAGNTVTVLAARILPIPLMTYLAAQCGQSGLCKTGLGIGVDTAIEVAFGLAATALIIAAKPYFHKLWHSAAPLAAAAALALTTPHAASGNPAHSVMGPAPQTAAYHMDIRYRV